MHWLPYQVGVATGKMIVWSIELSEFRLKFKSKGLMKA